MLSVSNLLCDHAAGNERLRYGHTDKSGPPRPVVVWAVTKACNLRCVHCYASATPGPAEGELTREEGFALLDDLKSFNVPAVLFSGGEPLVRPDTLDFIGYAASIGLTCTLSTNGMMIDAPMADRVSTLGLKYAGISIDGVEKQHDKLRGQQGAFQGALAGIRNCRERGIRVGVRFTVHALNQQYLEDIFQFCLDNDVQRLCVYHLAYAGRGGKMQKVDLTPAETRDVVDRLFALTRRSHADGKPLEVLTVDNHADAAYLLMQLEQTEPERAVDVAKRLVGTGGNRSGQNIAAIDPIGNVHYDQFSWHYNCGSIREAPFSEIWSKATDPRLAILRNRRGLLPQACQSCRFLPVCNGNLRTRAESSTGDWLGFDPSCYIDEHERHGPALVAG